MNEAKRIVLNGLSEITGLSKDELEEIKNENLFEMGILDSLSLAGLLIWIKDETGLVIDLSKYLPEEYSSIQTLIDLMVSAG